MDLTFLPEFLLRRLKSAPGPATTTRQDELLLALGRRGALASIGIMAGVTWVFAGSGVGWRFWLWAGFLASACALRTLAGELGLRTNSPRLARWSLRVYLAGMLATALLWGLVTTLVGRNATYELNVFLCFVFMMFLQMFRSNCFESCGRVSSFRVCFVLFVFFMISVHVTFNLF